jgi:hypothetical protein
VLFTQLLEPKSFHSHKMNLIVFLSAPWKWESCKAVKLTPPSLFLWDNYLNFFFKFSRVIGVFRLVDYENTFGQLYLSRKLILNVALSHRHNFKFPRYLLSLLIPNFSIVCVLFVLLTFALGYSLYFVHVSFQRNASILFLSYFVLPWLSPFFYSIGLF